MVLVSHDAAQAQVKAISFEEAVSIALKGNFDILSAILNQFQVAGSDLVRTGRRAFEKRSE
jgi:4-hydroxy-L-threonine phosphate dehydrogenase PdxA